MPVGIIPDISEQMCIGCALCVEICTTLGPDVLRVKPVEGWVKQTKIKVMDFSKKLGDRCPVVFFT